MCCLEKVSLEVDAQRFILMGTYLYRQNLAKSALKNLNMNF